MITTTHIILNTTILGSKKHPKHNWPIVWGAIFPDFPSFLVLFSPIYYAMGFGKVLNYIFFQTCTDWFHSIPLALAAFLLCLLFQFKSGIHLFASMALHDLEDLPVHAQIAHKHFLPFSQYVFHSPISYWEPQYHADFVAPAEWLLVIVCSYFLWRRGLSPLAQIGLLFVIIFQGALLLYFLGIHW
jgi:hypothetical protein